MVNRIEFMGIPGSGKTTLCNKVYNELRNQNKNISIFNGLYKESIKSYYRKQNTGFLRYTRFLIVNKLLRGNYIPASLYGEVLSQYIIENYSVYKTTLNSIIDKAPSERKLYLLKYLLMDLYKWEIIKENSEAFKTVLMDEGFSHRMLNIYMFNNKGNINSKIKNFFTTIGLPKVLIHVQHDINKSIDRMKIRKQGIPTSFRKYDRKELYNKLDIMNNFSEEVVMYLKNEGVKVIKVENNNLAYAMDLIIKSINTI